MNRLNWDIAPTQPAIEHKPYPVLTKLPKRKNDTAWIFGAGASLDYIHDWDIPDNVDVFTLNGGVLACQHKRFDYWFCFDSYCFRKDRQPEWDYTRYALSVETVLKIIPHHNIRKITVPSGYKNVYRYELEYRKMTSANMGSPNYRGFLLTGQSIIVPCLHWCWLSGYKRIILSGVDFCLCEVNGGLHRYNYHLRSMKHRGFHQSCNGKLVKSPCGDLVSINQMYERHYIDTMPVIRFLQGQEIKVVKTTNKGLVEIPFLNTPEELNRFVKIK